MPTAVNIENFVRLQENKYGKFHPKLANTLETMADMHIADGDFKHAHELYWRVLEIRQKIGGQSLDVASVLLELARLCVRLEKADEAEYLLRKASDLYKKLCGADSKQYLNTCAVLTRVMGKSLGEIDVSVEMENVNASPAFPWVEQFNHGVDLLDRNELFAAEELFSCLLMVAQSYAVGTIHHARSLDQLARVHLSREQFKTGLQLFEQALAVFVSTVGESDRDTVECIEGTGDAHCGLEEFEQARFMYQWVLALSLKHSLPEPAERVQSKLALLPFKLPARDESQPSKSGEGSAVLPESAAGKAASTEPAISQNSATPTRTVTPVRRKTGAAPKVQSTVDNEDSTQTHQPTKRKTTTRKLPDRQDTAATAAAGSLDDMLKDLATPRKKTTSAIVKPSLSNRSAANNDRDDSAERVVSVANFQKQLDLARQSFAQRDYQEAERKGILSMEIADKLFPPFDRRLREVYRDLAATSEAMGKYARAVHLYRLLLGMCEKALGADHVENAKLLEQLGGLYMVQSRSVEAEDCFQRALNILTKSDRADVSEAIIRLNSIKRRR